MSRSTTTAAGSNRSAPSRDHSHLGGLAILALVAAATTAIIVSATRSAMASNREIVEVLHFVGATDKFISREFEKHFLRLGIKAGIVGATLAMLVFMGMPAITELLGGGAVSAVEMQRLIGTGALDALGYIILGLVVVIIAGLCMVTSRVGVYRILQWPALNPIAKASGWQNWPYTATGVMPFMNTVY